MYPIPAQMLLTIWEQGWSQSSVWRALLLLAAALPETTAEALASLSIGQRDRHLLALREQLFGPTLPGVATCPACDEALQFTFNVADIMVETPEPGEHELRHKDYVVHLRPPNSHDLLAVGSLTDPAQLEQQLLARCVLSATRRGKAADADDLPDAVRQAIVEKMAQTDPQSDVTIRLTCPACQHEWSLLFDILSYLWQELDTWAWHTLYEVHQLAVAYGWSEGDSLALSSWRRRQYLEMAYG